MHKANKTHIQMFRESAKQVAQGPKPWGMFKRVVRLGSGMHLEGQVVGWSLRSSCCFCDVPDSPDKLMRPECEKELIVQCLISQGWEAPATRRFGFGNGFLFFIKYLTTIYPMTSDHHMGKGRNVLVDEGWSLSSPTLPPSRCSLEH